MSSGPDLTIEFMPNPSGAPHQYGPSSAFRLRYEFLDTSLGGAPLTSKASGPKAMPEPAALLQVQSKSCDRVYRFVICITCFYFTFDKFSYFLKYAYSTREMYTRKND